NTTYVNSLRGAAPDPILSIADLSQAEGSSSDMACVGGFKPFEFVVTANAAPATDLEFGYATTAGGDADAGTDYTAVTDGTGTILADETAGVAVVQVACDDDFEPDETFEVVLAAGAGYTIGTGTATGTL